MNPLTQSKNRTILPALIALTLGCFGVSPTARAVDPSPDGGYPNFNAAEGSDALCRDATGSDNAPANLTLIWKPAGSLKTARFGHTATLLQNGMVLVAGGDDSNFLPSASAELFDPANRTWTPTGSLNTARVAHTATLLQNGMVLVAGGDNLNGLSASAELYDPANGIWTTTGSLNIARDNHAATLLQNGMVLVAGGSDSNGTSGSAELYDPASGIWITTGNLNTARYAHTATFLQNGIILVAGGLGLNGDVLASSEVGRPHMPPPSRKLVW
jgi:N-acetylneuraminic acid mutarotase